MNDSNLEAAVRREGARTRMFAAAVFLGLAALLAAAVVLRLWF